ncbi:MAG: pyridoxal phosphate-dependent aminotransferase [Saprospiraceae bacterium]|nr:pyridoxal phosphate-dependent aminotransferase [Saprospiraceae bacterium]
MPKISSRGHDMPASPIRKLVPFADAAKAAGKHVIHLNIGQPDIKTPKAMLDAVRHFDESVLAYTQSAGNPSYRSKLAQYYDRVGIAVGPENIIVTTGGSEALYFAMFSCLDPGDEVIIPEPFYANYNGFSKAGNITVKPITASIENGFALPAIEEFEKRITPKTKAVMICNPNNPTGYLYSKAELMQLREIVLKHDLFLFADEVYREFAYDGVEHYSILNLDGLDNHAVVVDSISKRYSACGARIGCLVTRNQDVLATALKFAQARLSPPAIEQAAAEAAVDVPASYMDAVKEEYVARRDYVVRALNNIPGVFVPQPGGAFYCIVQLPVESAEDFCKWLLTDFEHEGYTIMLAPAAGFYSTPNVGLNEARLAYVLNKSQLEKAVDCLKHALEAYKML